MPAFQTIVVPVSDLESAKREALETKRVLHEAERGTPAPKPAGETVEAWIARW